MNDFVEILLKIIKEGKEIGIFAIGAIIIERIFKYRDKKQEDRSKEQLALFESKLTQETKKIQLELDKSIEDYKSKLLFLNEKLIALHSKQLEKVESLHEKLISLADLMIEWKSKYSGYIKEEEEELRNEREKLLEKVSSYWADIHNFLISNRMYFSEALSNKLTIVKTEFYNTGIKMLVASAHEKIGKTPAISYLEAWPKINEAVKKIGNDLPIIIKDLENEFRKIIGSNINGV